MAFTAHLKAQYIISINNVIMYVFCTLCKFELKIFT